MNYLYDNYLYDIFMNPEISIQGSHSQMLAGYWLFWEVTILTA